MIYQEKIPTYKIITIFVGIITLAFIYAIYREFVRDLWGNWLIKGGLTFFMILDLVILLFFYELKVKLDEGKLSFGYGPFKKSFELSKLENVEISEYKFLNYGGYGIRYGRDKSIGYTPRGGKGLKVKFIGEKVYFFNTAKPEELKNIILQYAHKK